MPKATYKVLLDAPLEAVWAFHEDIELGLRTLSPPEADVRVTRADEPALGCEVVMRVKAPPASWWGGRVVWHAKYVRYEPPAGDPPHRRALFADEQLKGPFAKWVHTHTFQETVDEGRAKVWASDEVVYRPPLGPLGVVADKLFVRRQVDAMFAFRHKVMRERLSRR